MLSAYSQGIFPWYEPGCPILWWSPHPRLLLYPERFILSHSLKKRLHQPYRLSIDTAFAEIIAACATVKGRVNNTWITAEMQEAYCELHQLGFAHSFEIWLKDHLVGGLYGLSLGNAFFGESMFHYERDASKIAMYYLCQVLSRQGFDFIDCQMPTSHLLSLGAEIVSRNEFLHQLQQTLQFPSKQGSWIDWASCIG